MSKHDDARDDDRVILLAPGHPALGPAAPAGRPAAQPAPPAKAAGPNGPARAGGHAGTGTRDTPLKARPSRRRAKVAPSSAQKRKQRDLDRRAEVAGIHTEAEQLTAAGDLRGAANLWREALAVACAGVRGEAKKRADDHPADAEWLCRWLTDNLLDTAETILVVRHSTLEGGTRP